jgi:23S rRNA pseudoU1915 N3-methylase RlmH
VPLDLDELTAHLLDIKAEQAEQAKDIAVIKERLEHKTIREILTSIGGALGAAVAAWFAYKGGS